MSCDFFVYMLKNCVFSTYIDPKELRKNEFSFFISLITKSLKIAISLTTISIEIRIRSHFICFEESKATIIFMKEMKIKLYHHICIKMTVKWVYTDSKCWM